MNLIVLSYWISVSTWKFSK